MFLVFHADTFQDESFFNVLKVFVKSLKLDISSVSYILIIPFILSILQYFSTTSLLKKVSKYYHIALLGILSFINVADIILFDYWKTKISLKSLLFLNTPDQILGTIGKETILMALIFIVLHFMLGFKLLNKYNFTKKLSFRKSFFSFVFFCLISALLTIVGIRGGLQNVPINQSQSYFSKNNTLNVAGINPLWNFMNVLLQNANYGNNNPYKKMELATASSFVDHLYRTNNDSTTFIFKSDKPNIVLITLEGVNANVFNAFSKEKSYAPNIEKLFSEGYLFTNMYSAGFRSDQGMVSILSGFPPTPVSSICAQPEKFSKLPSLPKSLQKENYNCSFFFGGEASFGNFKSYLIHNGFSPLYELKDFPKEQFTQNLGVPDEFVFEKFSNEMKNTSEPFFSMIFTQTTHEPYDMPFNEGVSIERTKYLNTVLYVDSIMGKWYSNMKTMPWYDNTIFILTSDHAHYFPGKYDNWTAERYHIPFLLFGNALKDEFKGNTNNKICSQVDIPKTILNQLKLDSKDFKWSKDFLNPFVNEFAFFTYVEGYTLKTKDKICGWEYNWKKTCGDCDSTFHLKQGQAFLQVLYEDYLSY